MRPIVPGATGATAFIIALMTPLAVAGERVAFEDATDVSGVGTFNHFSYTFGGNGLAGAAWFDYNDDGLLDLYLPNGMDIVTPGQNGYPNALFENQGDGTFVDVAAAKGVTNGTGNSGVIAGDIDNDGDQDIFLTGDGGMLGHDAVTGNQSLDSGVTLYINNGPPGYDFTTADNEAVGLSGFETTMSAAFGDVDGDGLIDLFVSAPGNRPNGCQVPPSCDSTDPTVKLHSSRLYLNRSADGNIAFRDVTVPSTIGESKSGALATAFTDYNRDGRLDLIVVNGVTNIFEPTPVSLYRNIGNSPALQSTVFADVTDQLNLQAESAWMGIAGADFDGDLGIDFFITNTGGNRPHALYHWSAPQRQYNDVAAITLIDGPSPSPSDWFGWGATAQDFDNDGRVDLYFAGSPPPAEGVGPMNPGILAMNDPPIAKFQDYTANTGVDLSARYTSGVAGADYDNDGRVDIVVATDNWLGDGGKPALLHNVTQNDNRWITVRLTGNGTTTNRDAFGARVAVLVGQAPDRQVQMREVYGGSSFLSMDSQWLTFGLGAIDAGSNVVVAVDWPDGPQSPGAIENWSFYGPFSVDGFADIIQD